MTINTMITTYIYTVQGTTIRGGRFEDSFICDKEYTEDQVIFIYNANSSRGHATAAVLEAIEYIEFNPMSHEVVNIEREEM